MMIWLVGCIFIGTASGDLQFFEEGKSATLECVPEAVNVKYWFLNGTGSAIQPTSVSSSEEVYMNEDGTLHFKNVSRYHDGNHVCVVEVEESLQAFTVKMNVRPLPAMDLWTAQYRSMFVTGFIAAFICLVLLSGFCLVKKYRWRAPLTKVEDPKLVNSFVNQGMTPDEGEQYSIRM